MTVISKRSSSSPRRSRRRAGKGQTAGRTPVALPPSKRKRIFGIRLIVTSGAVAITAVAVLCVGAVQERNARAALTTEIETRLLLEARNLALASSSALLAELPELVLLPLVREMQTDQPELSLAVVANHEGIIQGHADPRMLGTRMSLPADLRPEATGIALRSGETLMGNEETLLATAPVNRLGGPTIGTAAVGIRRDYITGIIAASHRQQSLVLAVVLALGVAAALVLMTFLLRPIGPLRAGLVRIGEGDLETPIRLHDRTELGMLADAVDEMACRLGVAQKEMVEKERLSHEMDLARDMQASLLPKSPTVAGSFLINGAHRPASEVGGDYYDVFSLADGRIAIAVADVSGKGLAGCLVMSMLSVLLRAFRDDYDSPAALLVQLDGRLSETLSPGSFVTMFYGILDPASGKLTFASAGHQPLMIHRSATGQIEQIRSKGIPLGAIRGGAIRRTLADEVVTLEAGDILVQYTDGVNEAFDLSGQTQFDFERMVAVLQSKAPGGCDSVIDGLRSALDQWRQGSPRGDDETILVVSRERLQPLKLVSPQAEGKNHVMPRPASPWLALARKHGTRLDLTANLDEMDEIPRWLESMPELGSLEQGQMQLLATAIYEACANIVEHGYNADNKRTFQLWWIPAAKIGNLAELPPSTGRSHPADGTEALSSGAFVILDHGKAFSPDNWVASDLSDPKVRRRSRGFGLDIIHKVMARVIYQPARQDGNATILVFDPTFLDFEERSCSNAG
jgi:serine phosphatase RsbU (regulator of sigma subunit)